MFYSRFPLQVQNDLEGGVAGSVSIPSVDAGKERVTEALVTNIEAMMGADRKITALKQLQVITTLRTMFSTILCSNLLKQESFTAKKGIFYNIFGLHFFCRVIFGELDFRAKSFMVKYLTMFPKPLRSGMEVASRLSLAIIFYYHLMVPFLIIKKLTTRCRQSHSLKVL